jgi:hypothetical protein
VEERRLENISENKPSPELGIHKDGEIDFDKLDNHINDLNLNTKEKKKVFEI